MSTSSFCTQCGHEFAPGANFCSACGAVVQPAAAPGTRRTRLVRPRQPRMLAGVCAGLAIYFGWDVSLTRVVFPIFACITSGFGAILYFFAWILIPEAQYALPANTQRQGNTV